MEKQSAQVFFDTKINRDVIQISRSRTVSLMSQYADNATASLKEENERLRAKAERWDALESKIGKFYEDDSDADLGDIGEAAAVAFGYL
jgi:uncharacterized protein with GYD domain